MFKCGIVIGDLAAAISLNSSNGLPDLGKVLGGALGNLLNGAKPAFGG